MPTIIEEYIIEEFWDCSACQNVNPGRSKKCSKCGKFLTNEVCRAPEDTSSVNKITDEILLAQAAKGPDYVCRHDRSRQISGNGECEVCGAGEKIARGQEDLSNQQSLQNLVQEAAPEFVKETKVAYVEKSIALAEVTPKSNLTSVKPTKNLLVLLLTGLAVAGGLTGLIWFLVWLFTPKYLDGTVSDVYFQHTVHVEKQVLDSGFDPDPGAFNIVEKGKRFSHNEQVPDGVKKEPCKKKVDDPPKCTITPKTTTEGECVTQENGFLKCKKITTGGDEVCEPQFHYVDDICEYPKVKLVPVERMWYIWHEWEYDRSAAVSGHTNEVFWPTEEEIALKPEERISGKDVSYRVTFVNQDNSWNYTPGSLQEFKQLKPGTVKHLKIVIGMVTVLP